MLAQVTLANYSSQQFGSATTVAVTIPPLSGGFAYINIHLDYGLKGTVGWAKGTNDAAVSTLATRYRRS